MIGLDASGVAKFRQEQVRVVVWDKGVAEGDPCHDRRHNPAVGAREVREEPISHDGQDPDHLMDDVFGLDIHHAPQRVVVLELNDEAQDGLKACAPIESGDRLGHPTVIFLLLVDPEALEQGFFRREPAIQSHPRHSGSGRNRGHRELPRPRQTQYLRGCL